jgi:hypothetical protein
VGGHRCSGRVGYVLLRSRLQGRDRHDAASVRHAPAHAPRHAAPVSRGDEHYRYRPRGRLLVPKPPHHAVPQVHQHHSGRLSAGGQSLPRPGGSSTEADGVGPPEVRSTGCTRSHRCPRGMGAAIGLSVAAVVAPAVGHTTLTLALSH